MVAMLGETHQSAMAGILLIGNEPEAPVQVVALEEVLMEDLNLLPSSGVSSGGRVNQEGVFAMAEGGF